MVSELSMKKEKIKGTPIETGTNFANSIDGVAVLVISHKLNGQNYLQLERHQSDIYKEMEWNFPLSKEQMEFSSSKLTKDLRCVTKFLPNLYEFQILDSGKTIFNAKECRGLYYLMLDLNTTSMQNREPNQTLEYGISSGKISPNSELVHMSLSNNDVVPIALRKGKITCTKHIIEIFVSYGKLSQNTGNL